MRTFATVLLLVLVAFPQALLSQNVLVRQNPFQTYPAVKFRGWVDSLAPCAFDATLLWIKIDEIFTDESGELSPGSTVIVFFLSPQPQSAPVLVKGDYVEVTGTYRDVAGWCDLTGKMVFSSVESITKLSSERGLADLVAYGCGVSPANPKQEDSVFFYGAIGNVGQSDAPNFRVELYLDGGLYDSGYSSLGAGEETQLSSDKPWSAEDGSHTIMWMINPDRSVQESNYGNNEGSCTFYVSPRTVTLTEYATITKTRTQTEKQTLTITTTRTLTLTHTIDTTAINTVTASPVVVTSTLTGLATSTVYSPTVTTTMTVTAEMISNPLVWMILSTFTMIGAVFQLPKSDRLRKFCRRFSALFPLSKFFGWISRRELKALISSSLILIIVVSITSQAGQQAYASTVTTTRTLTSTEWATLTQSTTSTRYITATSTTTSLFTSTRVSYTTTTPMSTRTLDQRSTTTNYVPTTTTLTTQAPKGPHIELTLDYNTQSSFISVVGVTIPLPVKTLGLILNEVRATVNIANTGSQPARSVSVGFTSPSSGGITELVEGDTIWSGDLNAGQTATFHAVWHIGRCLPVLLRLEGGYKDAQGNSFTVDRKESTVPAQDFILMDVKGGWSEVSLCPEDVQNAKSGYGEAGKLVLWILVWTEVAEKILSVTEGEDIIDKAASESWDAIAEALGGINVGFEAGLVFETWNLKNGADSGRCWAGNCVVFPGDKTMEYWIVWWSPPDLVASVLKEAFNID